MSNNTTNILGSTDNGRVWLHNESDNYSNQLLPILSGDRIPNIKLSKTQILSSKEVVNTLNQEFFLTDLIEARPIVIAFLSITEKFSQEEQWNSLLADIRIMGGQLIVITNGGKENFSHRLRTKGDLFIIQDNNSKIAEQFGLYDSNAPVSDWLVGITHNVPIPAIYTVATNNKVVFHHIDYTCRTVDASFDKTSCLRSLLTSVYEHTAQHSIFSFKQAIS